MDVRILPLDDKFLTDFSYLLYNAQEEEFSSLDIDYKVSVEMCKQLIQEELSKEVSSSFMVVSEQRLIGFAIATIKRDSIWGDSGWVNLGGWALQKEYAQQIYHLYKRIAQQWVDQGIKQHYFMVYNHNREFVNLFNELGFSKEQTHGVLSLEEYKPSGIERMSKYTARRGVASDQEQISGFAHLIADFRIRSPCFAAAPPAYLKSLTEKYRGLATDQNADLFVADVNNEVVGYQVYYGGTSGLITPPKSVELSVSGVKEDHRGRGVGFLITSYALAAQKERGFDFVISDWRCANLLSSRFWKSVGFRPVAHRLVRHIDPLI